MAASRDGSRLVAVGTHIELIDTHSGKRIAVLGEAENPRYIIEHFPAVRAQFTDDSKTVMVIADDMKARFFNAVTGEASPIKPFPTKYGAVLSGDGETIAVLNEKTDLFDVASRGADSRAGIPSRDFGRP